MKNILLQIKNLRKSFNGVTAVDGINVKIPAGEIYALIGPNGSGKTTTVKMITGLYRPEEGDVLVNDLSIAENPERVKSQIGYIPDEPFVYERLTGREFLNLTGVLFGVPENVRREKIEKLLGVFPLAPVIDGYVDYYSRGNKQKLSILAALLHDPKLLVIDEPIVGLDPESARKTKELFKDFAGKGGSVFVCTHTLSFAEDIAHRIGLLKEGKIIHEGTLDELRRISGGPGLSLEEVYLKLTS